MELLFVVVFKWGKYIRVTFIGLNCYFSPFTNWTGYFLGNVETENCENISTQ